MVILSSSCSQIIDIDIPEHEPVWTLNGNITAGDPYYVFSNEFDMTTISSYFNIHSSLLTGDVETTFSLSKTVALTSRNNQHTFYNDGEMLIFKGDDIVERPEPTDSSMQTQLYRYISKLEYEPGETYLFQMTTNDDTELSATQTMPEKVIPRNVSVDETLSEYIVTFTIDDPSDVNHYLFQSHIILHEFGILSAQLEFNVSSPDFFWYYEDFDFLEDGSPYRFTGVLSDNAFNGQSHQIEMRIRKDENLSGFGSNKKLIIEISSLSQEMHRFFQSFAQTSLGFTPFSEPAILNFNVENGFGAIVGVTTSFLEIDL